MSEKTNITINSAVLYVAAFLVTTIIHEFAHALFGMIHNSSPVLHHNYVEHLSPDSLTASQSVSIALAGPLASLVQGILAGIVYLKIKKHNLATLFILWFSILGLNNFLGYMMTGPVFEEGDIGRVFVLSDISPAIQLLAALLAALVLLFVAYKLTAPFLEFSYNLQWVDTEQSRVNFSWHIIILPWLIGSAIMTVVYLPIVAIVSIIYPVMSGMVFIFPWQNARRIKQVPLSPDKKIGAISVLSLILLLSLVFVFRLILAPGIPL